MAMSLDPPRRDHTRGMADHAGWAAASAVGTLVCAFLFAYGLHEWLDERTGGLPHGSELALAAYVTAASIAALTLALWARSRGRGFVLGLWTSYAAALIAGAAGLAVEFTLLYGSGTYVKSYGGIVASALSLVARMAVAHGLAARIALGRGLSLWLIGAFAAWSVLALVLSLVLLPLLPLPPVS